MRLSIAVPCSLALALMFSSAALRAAAPVPQSNAQSAPVAGDQAKNMLQNIFLVSARVQDLLGLAKTSNLKTTDAEKSAFEQDAESVADQLQALEKWRYQFFYHPDDVSAGGKTLNTLDNVIPGVERVAKEIDQSGGSSIAAQFKQSADQLSRLRNNLKSYLEEQFPGKFVSPPAPTSAVSAAQKSQPTTSTAAPNKTSQSAAASKKATSAPPSAPVTSPQSAPPAPQVPPAEATEVSPKQVRGLLQNVFLTEARVNDLLSLLQPEKWKVSDAERALFNERLKSVQGQLKALEQWRYQFYYNSQKTELGEKTVASLNDLIPGILSIETLVAQYESPAVAGQFGQAAKQLTASRNSLGSYVAFLQAQAQRQLAAQPTGVPGGKGLQTERINVPPPAAPVSSLVVVAPPLTPAQVKSILYNVYISEYRVRDLLGQEHPDRWKDASAGERAMALQARAELLSRLDELEKWRRRFSLHPDNMYDAFQTYRAVNNLFHPLRVFGREAGKYESENSASDYSRREDEMEAQMNGLVPYIGFILQHADRNLETFQTDLASCQNELGYAMHSSIRPPEPMKNVVPVFQGRRRTRRSDKKTSKKNPASAQHK